MSDILVLGATGYTGRLIARYLAHHPQRSTFSLALGARSEAKLEALKRDLTLDDSVALIQVDVSNRLEVEQAIRNAKVVVSAVGPYWTWGVNVVRYDYLAAKTGAILVPSCGFDSVPADLLVMLNNRTLKAAAGAQVALARSLSVYRIAGAVSGGTFSTALTLLSEVSAHELREAWDDYGLSTGICGAPSPSPPLCYTIPFAQPGAYALAWPMMHTNRAIVQRTWGLRALAAQGARGSAETADEAAQGAYGPRFTYEECLELPWPRGWLPVAVLNVAYYFTMAVLAAFPPARWLLRQLAPAPGQGPAEASLERGFMEVTNYASADTTAGARPVHVRTTLRGRGDPGYALASVMVAEAALGLLLERDALPAIARGGGLFTPATALGEVLVRRMERSGRFEFVSEVVGGAGAGAGEDVKTR
ncbi:uncharacterized protein FIBRA_06971 [Fibroporia radiculosa]|uniref:Saccharopine dehydrogenase NADP binding domain-containing protein n=1 Tax=Fibroporia radiculosa TaxID=599839 RepID=J4GU09_9APHY|nr:uncharacterized protein FIBRA_06971 [Fibroporia radiculosa]CCM04780.1 predicted protein [Fibroporia radiculosa]